MAAALLSASFAALQPHVLLVVADDYGWNDVGYHQNQKSSANPGGHPTTNVVVRTPVIDRLAAEGTKLENYYVQPLCSPTRGTIMTGRYPSHTGVGPNVIKPTHPYGMPGDETMLAQKFKEAGYETHAVGKWHLGYCDERYSPTYRGFDSFTGYLNGAEDYWDHTRADEGFKALDLRSSASTHAASALPAAKRDANGTYSTSVWTSEIERIVAARTPGTPTFVYMPFQSVHGPLQAPQADIDKYPASLDKSRRTYAGMVSALDAAVGEIEATYVKAGMWNQTVLIFSTDNGGPLGSANNFPLRGHKATAWEGGVRGVAFVRGTHDQALDAAGFAVPAGTTRHELMHSSDWFATLSSLGGYSLDGAKKLDGVDQWGVVARGESTARQYVIHNCPTAGAKRGGGLHVGAGGLGGHHKLLFAQGGKGGMQVPPNTTQTPPPGFSPHATDVCAPPLPAAVAIGGEDVSLYLFDLSVT